jgi:hypothetical protein
MRLEPLSRVIPRQALMYLKHGLLSGHHHFFVSGIFMRTADFLHITPLAGIL